MGLPRSYDADGLLVGIEILNAVRRFGSRETLRKVILEEIGPGATIKERNNQMKKKEVIRLLRELREQRSRSSSASKQIRSTLRSRYKFYINTYKEVEDIHTTDLDFLIHHIDSNKHFDSKLADGLYIKGKD